MGTKNTLPTIGHNTQYQGIFNHFNDALFDGKLHSCMLTMSRNNNVIGGYFSPDKWINDDGLSIHEIAVNSNIMRDSSFPYLMNVIVHEMIHLEQYLNGTSSRNGYHNQKWMTRAKELGLTIEGSGQKVGTDIEPGGAAEAACASLPSDLVFDWVANPLTVDEPKKDKEKDDGKGKGTGKTKSGGRHVYQCPVCGTKVWGKAGLSIGCLNDDQRLIESE
jgi:hypothetical protein